MCERCGRNNKREDEEYDEDGGEDTGPMQMMVQYACMISKDSEEHRKVVEQNQVRIVPLTRTIGEPSSSSQQASSSTGTPTDASRPLVLKERES